MVRPPVVAGSFYPGMPAVLSKEVDELLSGAQKREKVRALGAMVPHAGYMYSGSVAAKVFAVMEPRGLYVIIGPNHTGFGVPFAVSGDDWRTPLGVMKTDTEFADALIAGSGLFEEDEVAHVREHSVEVEIPFIQATAPRAKVVCIAVMSSPANELVRAGVMISKAVKTFARDAVIIASSDMTHYEPETQAARKDKLALDMVKALDPEGLMETVRKNRITMCGAAPTAVMLSAARAMGAGTVEVLKYATSGDITGDTEEVVGYAGVIVS